MQLKKQDTSFVIPAIKNTNGELKAVDPSEAQLEAFFTNINKSCQEDK